jgi:4-diphosphocytidyl-2-C-methyl-D-erythritol kinase
MTGLDDALVTPLTEIAYAKINLALHVRARRDDGYHRLETLFAFAEDGDRITAAPSDKLSLVIDGPFSTALTVDDDNLVLRAARAVQAEFGLTCGASITLEKNLPVAAGIGGGSADAAATIRILARLWNVDVHDPRILAIAASLGADVPACLESRTVRGEGVGDVLIPVDARALSGTPILLVNDFTLCPTGPVFKAWDGVDRGALGQGTSLDAIEMARNDLAAPAIVLVPSIADLLRQLQLQDGVLLSRMSGSGATCFALFDSRENCRWAAMSFPDVWYFATTLR